MKRQHFEQFAPVCPVCRDARQPATSMATLAIGHIDVEVEDTILTGILRCTNDVCCHEYPIVDGVPIILPDVRGFVEQNVFHLLQRNDLPDSVQSLIGDCCGPQSALDTTRLHLSSYGWDHYGDLGPSADAASPSDCRPGSVLHLLRSAQSLLGSAPVGPIVDVGCSVGRTTFELASQAARHDALILGVDVNFSMLQVAARVLHQGVVQYPLRQSGLVFHQQRYEVEFTHREQVDFWLCDGACLPLASYQIGMINSLNVLDSVSSPHALLSEFSRVLQLGGAALIGCPYDWTGTVTPVTAWLGGHSQRGPYRGDAESLVRSLLDPKQPFAIPGLQMKAETPRAPWTVRMHERAAVRYDVHLIAAEKIECEAKAGESPMD